jgi:phage gp36-like protein
MTTYATLDDLLAAATNGWEELAQRGGMSALVDGDLLYATAQAADRSAWSLEAQAAADAALVRLNDALVRASSHADTYMFPPLPHGDAIGTRGSAGQCPAQVWWRAIALQRLYGTSVPEEVRKGTQWAHDYLRDLSKGVVSLGAVDVTVAQPAGHVITRVPAKAF